MSILIRGMEMPTNREVTIRIDPNGEVYVYGTYPTLLLRAVPLPEKHGRLIDADALLDEDDGYYTQFGYSPDKIREAPTIVPAEGGGEE